MQLGNSAGIAAAMAARQNKAVQALNPQELQENLTKKGIILSINHQVWNGEKDIKK
jgi:hypothetical protein